MYEFIPFDGGNMRVWGANSNDDDEGIFCSSIALV